MSSRFSETLMDHFENPRNQGRLAAPSGIGVTGVPGGGPFLMIQIYAQDRIVKAARFASHPCGVAVACGSMLTTMVVGQLIDDLKTLTAESLIESLEGVPPDKGHVPGMAIEALQSAIRNAEERS